MMTTINFILKLCNTNPPINNPWRGNVQAGFYVTYILLNYYPMAATNSSLFTATTKS